MSQVIVYSNPEGGVCVCYPTGEISINQVLVKDCPAGAIIIDSSVLPQGTDALFQSSWVLNGNNISVNITVAQFQQTSTLNQLVYNESAHRAVKTLAGLTNTPADSDWNTLVSTARTNISSSITTADLVSAIEPIQSAITANSAI
jgi:hypothetical protein